MQVKTENSFCMVEESGGEFHNMGNMVEVRHLKKYFDTAKGINHAVDDVTFSIGEGKTMGVVGESGCGKSTLGRTIIRLQNPTAGQIFIDGQDVINLKKSELHKIRCKAQLIFQDPYSSLNPRMTVGKTIREALVMSRRLEKSEFSYELERLMDLVGVDMRMRSAYPHELDGGRRQRVGIARALAMNPKFIVCDEPVSALDVSIQAQILNLLMDLQKSQNLTYMFVTHDMSVVRHISNDICVMYLGQVMEICDAKELFQNPVHPYTRALLSAIPSTDIDNQPERIPLRGEVTSPIDPEPGCRFAARCPYACEDCFKAQELAEVSEKHFVFCCKAAEFI